MMDIFLNITKRLLACREMCPLLKMFVNDSILSVRVYSKILRNDNAHGFDNLNNRWKFDESVMIARSFVTVLNLQFSCWEFVKHRNKCNAEMYSCLQTKYIVQPGGYYNPKLYLVE